ncbi:MAG: PilZ domain-containing protein [Deltaproteobacteria bacterium]|nr:PilZ domain-containing protein [Deltaproteobacteria bacterium]
MYFFKSQYSGIEELLDSFDKENHSLFCPISLKTPESGNATIEIHTQGFSENLLVLGKIDFYQKSIPRKGIRGGYFVSLDNPEEEKVSFFIETYLKQGASRRRRYPRLSVTLDVLFRITGTPPKYSARLLDIAEGGARIETKPQNELVGKTISIEIKSIHSLRPIVLLAEVVNTPESGVYGIKWLTREKGIHSLLKEFIRRLKNGLWIVPLTLILFFPSYSMANLKAKYSYTISNGGINHTYSLEAGRNGSLNYYHGIGKNPPEKKQLRKDPAFTQKLFAELDKVEKKN